jgi:hypothetical protein
MNLTIKSLAALAAVSMLTIAAPVSGASAATTPAAAFALPEAALPAAGFGFPYAGALPFVPGAGLGTVVGPAIITTAPTSFINTNNQVTAGSAVSGGQLAAP